MHRTLAATPRRLFVAATLLGLSACADLPLEAPSEADSGQLLEAPSAQAELVRMFALALRDPEVRLAVHEALKTSPVVENKVFLETLLKEPQSAVVLDRMALAAEASPARPLELLRSLPPLEVYFPVQGHLQQWDGGTELLVASIWDESRDPIAFTTAGKEVKLSHLEVPGTPTLVVNPAESFDEQGEAHPWRLYGAPHYVIDEITGRTMTAAEWEAEMEAGLGGTPGEGNVAFEYKTQKRNLDVKEKVSHMRFHDDIDAVWGQGLPEFRVFLAGTTNDGNPDADVKYNHPISTTIWSPDGWTIYKLGSWMPADFTMLYWRSSYGNRVRIKCIEEDWGASTIPLTVKGSTLWKGVWVGFETTFNITDADDNCGASYVYSKKSDGTWTTIPSKSSGDYEGFSNLQWVGYGLQY